MTLAQAPGLLHSPSPRPSPAGRGRNVRRSTACRKSKFVQKSKANFELTDCRSLYSGNTPQVAGNQGSAQFPCCRENEVHGDSRRERVRVRERGSRSRCPRTRRTLSPFACFRHRERLRYLCGSPSPQPSPAGRGRIVRGLISCPKTEFLQRSKAKSELTGCCSLSRRERVRVGGNSTMSNQRAKRREPLANQSNCPLVLCPTNPSD